MSPIRAVCFDLFDTLVDLGFAGGNAVQSSTPLLHRALTEWTDVGLDDFETRLRSVDREVAVPMYREGREVPSALRFGALARALGVERDGIVEELVEIHMWNFREHVSVPEHHSELLAQLAERYRLAVCSNFSHTPTALRVLEDAGLAPHFETVVISESSGFRKPRREIFEETLKDLGCAPDETLHVGDRLGADVGGAASIGCRTAWITRQVSDPDAALADYAGPVPDWTMTDLAELLGVLEGR